MIDKTPDAGELRDRIAAWEEFGKTGTFEEAMAALESIVSLLDQGSLALEDSVRCFEIGVQLSNRSQQLLEAAQLRVSQLAELPEYDDETAPDPWLTGIE
jgi:exodeoxyribonuclease VII small subunit